LEEQMPDLVFQIGSKRLNLSTLRIGGGESRRPLKCLSVALALTLLSITSLCLAKEPIQVAPQQAAGTLDASFGTGGIANTDFGSPSLGEAVAQQADDKLVVLGFSTTGAGTLAFSGSVISRYNTDGTPDTGFGTNGTVAITAPDFLALALGIQQDGGIVVGGTSLEALSGAGSFKLLRLNTDGSTDMTFGNGLVSTSFPGASVSAIFSLAIQSDGMIVAAGTSGNDNTSTSAAFSAARYNTDGSLDTTFGSSGQVVVNLPTSIAFSVVLQPDGKIVLGGETGIGISGLTNILSVLVGTQFAVVRLNVDGTPDTAFGTSGVVQSKIGSGAIASQIVIQSDGNIVAAGTTLSSLESVDFAMIRYTTAGALDATFGAGGVVTTNFDGNLDVGAAVALQSDGKMVMAGVDFSLTASQDKLERGAGVAPQGFGSIFPIILGLGGCQIAVVRYNTDGSLDTSFGSNGAVSTAVGASAGVTSVLMQQDGKIVVAGATSPDMSAVNFAVVRYESGLLIGDFLLSPAETSQIVEAGSSVNFTVDVTLAADSLPPSVPVFLTGSVSPASTSVTAAFSPTTVTPGASSTLTVAAAAGAQPGNYTITIMGQTAAIDPPGEATAPPPTVVSHTVTVAVTVASGPDFDLGFSASSIPAPRNSKVPVTVDINRAGGFSGKVKVSTPTGLPAGIALKTANPQSTKGNSATFNFKIKPAAAIGPVQFTFTGTDKTGRTRTAAVTLIVQ
jgi:uncharacterized delta-60 repeat protein